MKSIITSLFILITAMLLYGCASSGADVQNYQDPNFQNVKLKKIAVLPVRNTYLNVGDANSINRYFMTELSRKTKRYEFVGPEESIEKLSKDSLVEPYYKYLVAYATTGIPNREIIKKVCESLGVDGIIQGEIFDVKKKDGSYGSNKGETRCQLRYSAVTGSDGKVVWESTVEAHQTTGTTLEDAPPLMDVVKLAMDKILESVPK